MTFVLTCLEWDEFSGCVPRVVVFLGQGPIARAVGTHGYSPTSAFLIFGAVWGTWIWLAGWGGSRGTHWAWHALGSGMWCGLSTRSLMWPTL
jgi:hypothetical protein